MSDRKNARDQGFSPTIGQTVAIICYALVYSHQPDVQISIIEFVDPVIAEFPSILIPAVLVLSILIASIVYAKQKRFNTHAKLEN